MKKVLVAPLNWGLGHASRCIPIIKELQKKHFQPVIASNDEALEFLKQEFPSLETLELPSYQISYGKHLKWNLIKRLPSLQKVVKAEQKIIEEYISNHSEVVGVISDNRFGVYSKKVPSVYITHQIRVLSGIFTPITSWVHQQIIQKFDECWIPDEKASKYSGKLSKSTTSLNQKYIGVLSRFEKKDLKKHIDILIVLSGPEPNRSHLEKKLIETFHTSEKNIFLIQGTLDSQQKTRTQGHLTILNYALSKELEKLLNASNYVICRSGYSSIMDLVSLGKPALLIPTKHQNEQEYLAKYHRKNQQFEVMTEKELNNKKLSFPSEVSLGSFQKSPFDPNLFRLFQGK